MSPLQGPRVALDALHFDVLSYESLSDSVLQAAWRYAGRNCTTPDGVGASTYPLREERHL